MLTWSILAFRYQAVVILFSVVIVSVSMDLFSHRNKDEVSFSDAAGWSIFWGALAAAFYY